MEKEEKKESVSWLKNRIVFLEQLLQAKKEKEFYPSHRSNEDVKPGYYTVEK